MKAIILAAGRGKRMGHLTDYKPKCLIQIKGTPLLEHQLETLKMVDIEEFGIVTGYKREMLSKYNLHEFYNHKWAVSNIMISLSQADIWLSSFNCIISYSDILYESDAIKPLISTVADIAIPYFVRKEDFPKDPESFKIKKGIVYEIGKNTKTLDEVEGQFMGLLKTTPNGWREITRVMSKLKRYTRDNIDVTGILQKVIEENNVSVFGFPYNGIWKEFDNENDVLSF